MVSIPFLGCEFLLSTNRFGSDATMGANVVRKAHRRAKKSAIDNTSFRGAAQGHHPFYLGVSLETKV
jgi:hypothetical protein